jgi:hypothetical protein
VTFLRCSKQVLLVTKCLVLWTELYKIMRLLAVSFGGLLAVVAGASAAAAPPEINAAESTVQVGVTAGYGTYEENILPQDTEAGALLGVQAGVSSLTPSGLGRFGWPDLYANVGYDFSDGLLRYRGSLQNPQNTPYRAADNSYYNTAIVRLGMGRPVAESAELIPYVAGGYQNWYRNISGSAGYGEFYQTGMVGGGVKLDVAASPVLVVSAMAEGFAVIGGVISVPSQNFSGTFGTSAEERVSLDADYRLTTSWHAFAGLGIAHYGYTGSKPDFNGAFEPLSTTLQVNSMFGLAYGF